MDTVLIVCGVISAIGGAGAVVYKYIIKPIAYMSDKFELVETIHQGQKVLMFSTASIMEHIITGNHIEKLKDDYEELIKFNIDK